MAVSVWQRDHGFVEFVVAAGGIGNTVGNVRGKRTTNTHHSGRFPTPRADGIESKNVSVV